MSQEPSSPSRAAQRNILVAVLGVIGIAVMSWIAWQFAPRPAGFRGAATQSRHRYRELQSLDTSGYIGSSALVVPWEPFATSREIAKSFQDHGRRGIQRIEDDLADPGVPLPHRGYLMLKQAALFNFVGEPQKAYQVLEATRSFVESDPQLAEDGLYNIIAFQGVTALRRGENDNCILCRGESSCILPISRAAVHANPEGSRRAIHHFTEYLKQFPENLEIRWLLNLAHMTLGEYPDRVDPRYLVKLDSFLKSEFDIGKFRDIGHIVGVNCFNQGGGAIMEDFDNDGLLDIARTSFDPTEPIKLFKNDGQGKFENRSDAAQLSDQFGGLNCMQTDYNNDGYMDIFVVRGAWLENAMRPSLLRNNQDGTFTDVTKEAGLLLPANSITASWADYDNDGWLDVFVCCERQPSRLHRNRRNGTFEDVTEQAGLYQPKIGGKGVAWIDYNNDGLQDLFVNYLLTSEHAQLFQNQGSGKFIDVTESMNIDGPTLGFSCWAWDYDNDGWLDIFATCYERKLSEMVKGLQGLPHALPHGRLFHNREGQGFENVTKEAGLDGAYSTMGSNFADFDNDGFLDMYLGTGEPELSTLVPNRMFKNVEGRRFAEITASSGTGNLQKGHGVACGDWDRDGNVDVFIQMGGAVPGDKYHNILFQNPGHSNDWLTVKLIGTESNRAAVGARIKIVTVGKEPRTIHRHISSGSSFGGNPMQQTIGLGQADRIDVLEVYWPKTKQRQVFRNIMPNQAIEITESANEYRKLNWAPVQRKQAAQNAPMEARKQDRLGQF